MERTYQGFAIETVAYLNSLVSVGHFGDYLIEDILMDDEPSESGAPLAAGAYCCEDTTLDDQL